MPPYVVGKIGLMHAVHGKQEDVAGGWAAVRASEGRRHDGEGGDCTRDRDRAQ